MKIIILCFIKLIQSICDQRTDTNPVNFHIIGHSLGSHIAGYAGQRLSGKLGRITGLDPAGPYFENTDPIVRLDPTDAVFVEVIHTDGSANLALGLGLSQPLGHVDYYPNGGRNQPKCPQVTGKLITGFLDLITVDLNSIEENFSCSHTAAFYYYIDSIRAACKFLAYPCKSANDFNNGKCLKCGERGCNRMGYWSSPKKDLGTLYLATQSPESYSYCKQSFAVTLESNKVENLSRTTGKFTVYFETKSGPVSSTELLDDCGVTFTPDSVVSKVVSFDEPIKEEITSLYITYTKTGNFLTSWMYDSQWSFRYVTVLNGEDQTTQRFCPQENIIETTKTVKFSQC